jgi:hypothetical protein
MLKASSGGEAMRKMSILVILWLVAIFTLTTACTVREKEVVRVEPGPVVEKEVVKREVVVVKEEPPAPPPARAEVRGVAPTPELVWVPGSWDWNGHEYVWVSGNWVESPAREAAWVPGHWERTAGGWRWVSGYWKR